MTYVDDRTQEERSTHCVVILATDAFMSGWGGAQGGASYAGWACRWEDRAKVYDWVRSRAEMKRVRIVRSGYRPNARYCAHCHIYRVNPSHPALQQ